MSERCLVVGCPSSCKQMLATLQLLQLDSPLVAVVRYFVGGKGVQKGEESSEPATPSLPSLFYFEVFPVELLPQKL